MSTQLRVEPNGESGGHCDCCGNETRTIWGYVLSSEQVVACYFLQWTRQMPNHYPNLDFLVGTWGDDSVNDRKLVSWLYNPAVSSFMAINGAARPAASSTLCSQVLTREDILNNRDLMGVVTEMIDAVWIGDPRVQEVKGLASAA